MAVVWEPVWAYLRQHCNSFATMSGHVVFSDIFHIISLHGKIWTQQIDLAPNELNRDRGGDGFESRGSPDIFQASSFQLLQLENLLRWSLFTFIFNMQTISESETSDTVSQDSNLLVETSLVDIPYTIFVKWHHWILDKFVWITTKYWYTWCQYCCQVCFS